MKWGLSRENQRWHHAEINYMMTSSNGNIFRITGPLCGEFTGDRWIPLTKASNAGGTLMFPLICALNKRLSKQSWGWWFETPSRSLWRHCNVDLLANVSVKLDTQSISGSPRESPLWGRCQRCHRLGPASSEAGQGTSELAPLIPFRFLDCLISCLDVNSTVNRG